MRRSLLLLTTMALGVLMVGSVAQAASPSAKCLQEAETLTGLDLTGYNVVVGNNRKADDFTSKATAGGDVFCGRGGNDFIKNLDEGDVFLGGAGNDHVDVYNFGTFYGGDGIDFVYNNAGFFDGGDGSDDTVGTNDPGGSIENVEIILF